MLFVLSGFAEFTYSQTYVQVNITQPAKLIANAGHDTTIASGYSFILGGTPVVTGGTSNYQFLWTPSTGLNNNTIAHPTATPADTTLYTLIVTDANGCSDTSSVRINVDHYVDLENISSNNQVKIFPNPNNGNFEIEISNIKTPFTITITNISGQIMYSERYNKDFTNQKIILDLSNMAKGDYHLQIKNPAINITRKIILY